MCKKLTCLTLFVLVMAVTSVQAAVVPITTITSTQVDNPDGSISIWLENITIDGFTVAVDGLVTGVSEGVATAQPAPYNDIMAADNFDLNLFAGRSNEDPPAHQIRELGGRPTWVDTNGDSPDFFIFETGGNQDINIEAILPGGVIGQSVTVATALWGDTGLDVTGTGTSHDGQSISGVALAITDLLDADGNALTNSSVIEGIQVSSNGYDPDCVCAVAASVTIPVDPNSDIAAANESALPGDIIEFAEGTYIIASQIEIKDGVTYRGAGPGLTIIDGNDTTRAFAAWGDRGATSGQVDANGVAVPNTTGPKDWVLDGMTIQNCVSDNLNRHDILWAARSLLDNYTADTPYTLEAAKLGANWAIWDNAGWFDILSGGADDNLTDVELQAYLDANPIGSDGHLVSDDDKDADGGAINIDNGAVGTIANCEFLNNSTPAGDIAGDGGAIHITGNSTMTITNCTLKDNHSADDGGSINIAGLSAVTINDCLFDGNYAVSPDAVQLDGPSGHGGHLFVQGGSASAITPGTTIIANRCVFLNGRAEDDGGVMRSSAVGSIARFDACWFEGNTAADDGTVLFIGNESSSELTVTNCVFANNISAGASDRLCQVRRNSKFINCTFVGNNQDDQDMIYNNANSADTDADGVDDEMADATQVINCIFANNVVGNGDDVLGSRNADFTIAAVNCLFFGNTLQNGNAADNTQRPADETGSVLADPLLDALFVPGVGSPAIDAGVDPAMLGVPLMTDYDGNARPQGAGYDIGAFEFVVAPLAN